jgi:hypothetical protein
MLFSFTERVPMTESSWPIIFRFCPVSCRYWLSFLVRTCFAKMFMYFFTDDLIPGSLFHQNQNPADLYFAPSVYTLTIVRHVTGNDKDYLRKIPRVVW